MTPTDARPPRAALVTVAVVCALLAAWVRWAHDGRAWRLESLSEHAPPQAGAWFSDEPDGLYHMRRVERALQQGGAVAGTDPLLNAPHGAPIPWPPYADRAAHALLAPLAPDEPAARRAYVERWSGWLPFLWSCLAVGFLAYATGRLASRSGAEPARRRGGVLAAACAGAVGAGQYAAVHYASPGVADHHAWVSLLNLGVLLALMHGWTRERLDDARGSWHRGIGAGVLMGLSLGSWAASLLHLLAFQAAFGLLLVRHARRPMAGLRGFGIGFHLAAAAVLLPAVWASPWRDTHPWMVVNLSWFHLVHLLLGAAVFLPLRADGTWRGLHPLALPLILVTGLLALIGLDLGPGAGIREGFAWVSRADEFMAGIAESEPLLGGALGSHLHWTSWSFFLLPFAWLLLCVDAWRRGRTRTLPLLVLLPMLFVQTANQIRFAEALAFPAALLFGLAASVLLARVRIGSADREGGSRSRGGRALQLGAGLLLGFALVPSGVLRAHAGWFAHEPAPDVARNAERALLEWIAQRDPQAHAMDPTLSADGEELDVVSVLAPWDRGHAIEWVCGLASVATNFGSYVGIDGYRAPSRFFLARDSTMAEALLREHRVRWVLRPSRLTLSMDQLQRAHGEGLPVGGFVETTTDERGRRRDRFKPAWFDTFAARLGVPLLEAPDGDRPGLGDPDGPDGPQAPLRFLRLVHVSPLADEDPRHGGLTQPFGLIWQHVPGAHLTVDAEAGDTLEVDLGIRVVFADDPLIEFRHRDSVTATAAGPLTLRLPYNTALPNGDAHVLQATWRLSSADGTPRATGPLHIPEEAVQQGSPVPLDQ